MVMSGSSTDNEETPLDWSFQNHTGELLRRGNHPRSDFRRCILDKADLTEGNFTNSDLDFNGSKFFHKGVFMKLLDKHYESKEMS